MRQRIVEVSSLAAGQTGARPIRAQNFALIMIDSTFNVRSVFLDASAGAQLAPLFCADATRLQPHVEAGVKAMIEKLVKHRQIESLTVRLNVAHSIRISPLLSEHEDVIALVVERDPSADRISGAAIRYSLTRRQIDVLLLALDGANAGEIARGLHISEYTAQGYVKSLLLKTGTRNRAAMVAKVLDWEALPPAG